MNIPKIIAELRSELDLLEASICAFELLAKIKEPEQVFMAVDVGSQLSGIAAEGVRNETATGTTWRKALVRACLEITFPLVNVLGYTRPSGRFRRDCSTLQSFEAGLGRAGATLAGSD